MILTRALLMLTIVSCWLGTAVITARMAPIPETITLKAEGHAYRGLVQARPRMKDGTLGPTPDFDTDKETVILVHGFSPNPKLFDELVQELIKDHNVFIFTYDQKMVPRPPAKPLDNPVDPKDPKTWPPAHTAALPGLSTTEMLTLFTSRVLSPQDAGAKLATAIIELDKATNGTLTKKGVTVPAHSLGGPINRYSGGVRDPGSDIPTLANTNIKVDMFLITPLLHGMPGMEDRGANHPFDTFFVGGFSWAGNAVLPWFWRPWDYSDISSADSPFLTVKTGANITVHVGWCPADGVIKPWAQQRLAVVGTPAETFTLRGNHSTVFSENAQELADKIRAAEAKRRDSLSFGSATGTDTGSTGEFRFASPGAAPAQFFDGNFYASITPGGSPMSAGSGVGLWSFNSSSATSGQNDPRTQFMMMFQLLLNTQARSNRDDAAWVLSSPLSSRFSLASMLFAGQTRTAVAPPPVKLALSALGVTSGTAFEIRAINQGDLPVSGSAFGVVVEPLTSNAGRKVVEDFGRASRNFAVETSTADAYCLERERESPEKGTTFRVAAPNIQQRFQPMRHVLQAAKTLEDRGALHPEGDRTAYTHFIRQWSIWAKEGGFNESRFVDALVAHGKKNVAGAGRSWTRQIEESVRGSAPRRWRDIALVLQEAARLDIAARR